VRLWDGDAGAPIGGPLAAHTAPVWSIAHLVGPYGADLLASTGDDGRILIWDTAARTFTPLAEETASQWSLATWTTPDGESRLASAGTDGPIEVWSPDTGRRIGRPLGGHVAAVRTMTTWWSGDPSADVVLASASVDGTIRFWHPETGDPAAEALAGHPSWLPALSSWIEADGHARIATGGEHGTIRVWDYDSREDVSNPSTGHTSALWTLVSWPGSDGSAELASAGDDAVIRFWSADTGAAIGVPLTGHTASIWAIETWTDRTGRRRLASVGDDAVIRLWDVDAGEAVGEPVAGHIGWIPGLTSWTGSDGITRLATSGIDGTLRVYDTEADKLSRPITGHGGWVMCVAAWTSSTGQHLLASGGDDGTVRIWDPLTGSPAGSTLTGHDGWVRSVTGWMDDGRPRLATGGFDHTVRIWDPEAGTAVGDPLVDHTALVARVVHYINPAGEHRLASGSDDATIRIWDATTGAPIGRPLTGHSGGVWALTSWLTGDGDVRLASAGYDGTVRLWDPERGRALRTIEVGPLVMWGLSDAPTNQDALGRDLLATAIAEQLHRPAKDAGTQAAGPTVVSVEGPWGSGKTTLMELVRNRLPRVRPPATTEVPRLTIRRAVRHVRGYEPSSARRRRVVAPEAGVVTTWFNPWAHESGEQVWAGLVYEIVESAGQVLYPTEAEREHYWFVKNLSRIDRFALLRVLLRRMVSPLLGVALAAVVVPLVIAVAELNWRFTALGHVVSAGATALMVAFVFLLAGAVHTYWRYWRSPVAGLVPSELLLRPVSAAMTLTSSDGKADRLDDPLRRAQAGSLYLYQHDVGEILEDLAERRLEMVILIDDLDRCRAATVAEVFEAINLFLSGFSSSSGLHAKFVLGLDPGVVAAHIDNFSTRGTGAMPPFGDDASAGWAFLRKLIQLPVVLPQVSDEGLIRFVEAATAGPQPAAAVASTVPDSRLGPSSQPQAALAGPASSTGGGAVVASSASTPQDLARLNGRSKAEVHRVADPAREVLESETLAWRSLERHPRIREFIVSRLAVQPDRSIREAKRLLNVWQLYQRILSAADPQTGAQDQIDRACDLIVLAEIVTRWPALQRQLHRRFDGGRGLELLATSAGDDARWRQTVDLLWPDSAPHGSALQGLRALLSAHDGARIATLAARLL
jgi:WD40 repeat protein